MLRLAIVDQAWVGRQRLGPELCGGGIKGHVIRTLGQLETLAVVPGSLIALEDRGQSRIHGHHRRVGGAELGEFLLGLGRAFGVVQPSASFDEIAELSVHRPPEARVRGINRESLALDSMACRRRSRACSNRFASSSIIAKLFNIKPKLLWKTGDSGWSRAIFCQIKSADSYDFSASAGLPIAQAEADAVVARSSSWYQVTEGLSSASFCRTFRAARATSAPRPACRSVQHDADVVLGARQASDELGDGGIVVGQLLIDCALPTRATSTPSGPLSGVVVHVGDAVVGVRQLVLEPGDGGIVVGQLLEACLCPLVRFQASARLLVTPSTKPMLP